MAVSLEEADRMIDAASATASSCIAGHTNSFELHIRAMRKVISSGRLGRLCAVHVWSYTDWMLRGRTPDELDPNQGGGIPWRQGPHQIDVVRLLGGGLLRSVRGTTGDWLRERRIPGYHSAFLEFEDGASGDDPAQRLRLLPDGRAVPLGAPEGRRYTYAQRAEIRHAIRAGTRDEETEKQAFRIGGKPRSQRASGDRDSRAQPWTPADLGMVVVSCERGDMRHSKYGLYVYADDGRFEIPLVGSWAPGMQEHRAELEELYGAVVLGRPVYHSGEWGAATLEACIAMIQSARERQEVLLHRQIAMPANYDADLALPPEEPVTFPQPAAY